MMQSHHTFEGHNGRIFSVALCTLPNGLKIAASASHDRTVRIWCVSTLQHLRTIEYTDFVWRVFIVLCPRPCVVAFISTEDKIQVSDLHTGETINIFYGRLVFSGHIPTFPRPIIITSTGEEDIAFLDVSSGQTLRVIRGGFEKVFRAVVSHGDRPQLVFTTWNAPNRRSTIQVHDMMETMQLSQEMVQDVVAERESNRQKMHLVFEGDSRDGVTSLVITLSSKPLICSGHYDFKVRLWSLDTKQLLMTLEGHTDYVGSVAAWKGNEPIVISGSSDGTVKVWDTQTGALICTGDGHQRDVWAVTVTQSPQPLIVSASFDRTVRVWDINPIIADLKWNRRKHFCIFLQGHGFLNPQPPSGSESPMQKRQDSICQKLQTTDAVITLEENNDSGGDDVANAASVFSFRSTSSSSNAAVRVKSFKFSAEEIAVATTGKVQGLPSTIYTCKVFHTESLNRQIAAYL